MNMRLKKQKECCPYCKSKQYWKAFLEAKNDGAGVVIIFYGNPNKKAVPGHGFKNKGKDIVDGAMHETGMQNFKDIGVGVPPNTDYKNKSHKSISGAIVSGSENDYDLDLIPHTSIKMGLDYSDCSIKPRAAHLVIRSTDEVIINIEEEDNNNILPYFCLDCKRFSEENPGLYRYLFRPEEEEK